jgi:hypothetical protein
MTGSGLIGNIMQQKQQNDALNRIKTMQNPANASRMIQQLTQPLNSGLVSNVGNSVQGYLGERGLSQSPNITANVLGQSLAPYEQQNQQLALQQFMALLNPTGSSYGKPADLTSLMSLFKPQPSVGANPAGGGTSGPFSYPGGSGPGGTPPFMGTDSISDSPIDSSSTYGGATA